MDLSWKRNRQANKLALHVATAPNQGAITWISLFIGVTLYFVFYYFLIASILCWSISQKVSCHAISKILWVIHLPNSVRNLLVYFVCGLHTQKHLFFLSPSSFCLQLYIYELHLTLTLPCMAVFLFVKVILCSKSDWPCTWWLKSTLTPCFIHSLCGHIKVEGCNVGPNQPVYQ